MRIKTTLEIKSDKVNNLTTKEWVAVEDIIELLYSNQDKTVRDILKLFLEREE